MNFWTPTWSPWADGRTDADLSWSVLYDYVIVFEYDTVTKEFVFDFRDDFTS